MIFKTWEEVAEWIVGIRESAAEVTSCPVELPSHKTVAEAILWVAKFEQSKADLPTNVTLGKRGTLKFSWDTPGDDYVWRHMMIFPDGTAELETYIKDIVCRHSIEW